jgi:phosphocarrier protein FPr
MTALVLAAPLAGWATRLEEVPDPAFAQGMVGDGVAIDPVSNELCAPCDATVVSVHRAHHACTLKTDGGVELLLHIGVDSVDLRGEGFEVLVKDGQRVRTGEPLIRFDLEVVARRARSLHTPVLLIGGEGYSVIERATDRAVNVGDFLLSIARAEPRAEPASSAPAAATATRTARLLIAHGLHARPAAAFSRRAKQHAGEVTVVCRQRSANGKSMAALMALDVRLGDELAITAAGPRAEAMATELAALVASGLGDPIAAAPERASRSGREPVAIIASAPFPAGQEVVLEGVAASSGLATGVAVRLADVSSISDPARDGAGSPVEHGKLVAALADVRRELEQMIAMAQSRGDEVAGDIFRAQLDLVDDPELRAASDREVAAGRSAAWAWQVALRELGVVLRGLGNPLLTERVSDLSDLERRTLARLAGRVAGRVPAELPAGAVLVADEILPSELAAVPAGRLAGLCTARGGATSHVAILASGMGVPAVVAIGDGALRIPDGAPMIVDGDRGRVQVYPETATRETVQRAIAGRATRRRAELAAAHERASTPDGTEIAVYANLGSVGDAAVALDRGAEGSGLLRTEFLFLERQSAPGEDEQIARYQQIAAALQGRPLVIRTLDAGGDKPLAYLPQVHEDNPALGVRGVRLALRHPAILRTQLRAILRVRPAGACRIMVPMITSLAELRQVRAVLDEERRAIGMSAPVPLGVMIEVPAAALLAETLAREAEFFSIGTNDLSQYALAMDRGNRDLAQALDALHPGVLRLVACTVAGARVHDRPVSVCGGAAADPCAVPIFIGLGVRTLSVAAAAVPEIKALIRTLSLARCAEIATAALDLESGEAVRELVGRTWPGLAAHHD